MTNTYTQAVDFIQDYADATDNVFEDNDLPGIESKLEYALLVLKSHQDYEGSNPPVRSVQ